MAIDSTAFPTNDIKGSPPFETMPIHVSPNTRLALGGEGLPRCESRGLLKDKFVFLDAFFNEDDRVALDLITSRGAADLDRLRQSWENTKDTQERKRAHGEAYNQDNLNKATAALDGTDPLRPGLAKAVAHSRGWLSAIPDDRKRVFPLATASRLLVGLANGVLENAGCSLHSRFGFPIIPSSALKGIARDAAAILEIGSADTQRIFGSAPGDEAALQGSIAFLDAWAQLDPDQHDIELDVVTPHLPKYYAGTDNGDALDEEQPGPSVFPAISAGVSFEFALVAFNGRSRADDLDTAKTCLEWALTYLGVGAKTAAGYGRFHATDRQETRIHTDLFPPAAEPELSAADQLRRDWAGKTNNTFILRRLVTDLRQVEDSTELAILFDELMPAKHLANYRAVNPYWAAFLREGGKAITERVQRPIPAR